MHEILITNGPLGLLRATAGGVRGEGRLLPRLMFDVDVRTPRENMEAHLQLATGTTATGQD